MPTLDSVYVDELYEVERRQFISIQFGGEPSDTEVDGCLPEDAIAVVIEHLQGLNVRDSPTSCREYSLAITALEEASNWLVRRRINLAKQAR